MIAPNYSSFVFNHFPPCCFWSTWSPPPLWPPLQCGNTVFLSVLPQYMPDPIPSSASDLITRSVHSCGLLDLLVRDGPWPSYSQYAFHAFVLKNVQLLCFCFREFPSFAAIHQNCSGNCFEQLNLRLPANFVTVPNSSQPVESLSGVT